MSMSDVLVVLKPDRRARARGSRSRKCARRSSRCPGVTVLFTTPLGMRIDEGLGGTPADVSVRIFGPDLDQLARLGAEARGDHGDDRRRRGPARRGRDRPAAAPHRDRSRGGGARRAHAGRRHPRAPHRPGWRGGVGGVGGAAPVRPRRPPGRSGAKQRRRHPRPAARGARRDARPDPAGGARRGSVRARHRFAARRAAAASRSRRRWRAAISAAPRPRSGRGWPTACGSRPGTSSTSAAGSSSRSAPRSR